MTKELDRPTWSDPVATSLSEVVGGPSGDHARPHSWWTPVRVVMAIFSITFLLGFVQKYPCGETNWSNNTVRYSKMCYSDVPYLYTARGFAEHRWPYSDDTRTTSDGTVEKYQVMEYPVLTAYFAWGASLVTAVIPSGPSQAVRAVTPIGSLWGLPGMADEVNTYFIVTVVMLFACGLVAMYFMAGASPGRPWDAMAMAASPALLVTGLVNWDLLAVMFTAGALWAWARGRPILAGVMIGLGVAAKLYPVFLLGAFLVDVVRRRKPEWFGMTLAGALGAWLVANLPAIMTSKDAWNVFWKFNQDRGADLGSFWLILSQHGHDVSAPTINRISGIVLVLACIGIFVLGLAARKRPQVAQIAFLVVAAFLVVNKVYSPQYVLWLLPLAVLARPRWRDLLIWQATELLYFAAVWMYLGNWIRPSSGDNPTLYQIAIIVRILGELYLVALVVRDIWTAEPDETEWSEEDWAEARSYENSTLSK